MVAGQIGIMRLVFYGYLEGVHTVKTLNDTQYR